MKLIGTVMKTIVEGGYVMHGAGDMKLIGGHMKSLRATKLIRGGAMKRPGRGYEMTLRSQLR